MIRFKPLVLSLFDILKRFLSPAGDGGKFIRDASVTFFGLFIAFVLNNQTEIVSAVLDNTPDWARSPLTMLLGAVFLFFARKVRTFGTKA